MTVYASSISSQFDPTFGFLMFSGGYGSGTLVENGLMLSSVLQNIGMKWITDYQKCQNILEYYWIHFKKIILELLHRRYHVHANIIFKNFGEPKSEFFVPSELQYPICFFYYKIEN